MWTVGEDVQVDWGEPGAAEIRALGTFAGWTKSRGRSGATSALIALTSPLTADGTDVRTEQKRTLTGDWLELTLRSVGQGWDDNRDHTVHVVLFAEDPRAGDAESIWVAAHGWWSRPAAK